MKPAYRKVIEEALAGKSVGDLSKKYQVTRARIWHILMKKAPAAYSAVKLRNRTTLNSCGKRASKELLMAAEQLERLQMVLFTLENERSRNDVPE